MSAALIHIALDQPKDKRPPSKRNRTPSEFTAQCMRTLYEGGDTVTDLAARFKSSKARVEEAIVRVGGNLHQDAYAEPAAPKKLEAKDVYVSVTGQGRDMRYTPRVTDTGYALERVMDQMEWLHGCGGLPDGVYLIVAGDTPKTRATCYALVGDWRPTVSNLGYES